MSDFEKGAEAAAERDRLRDALHDLRKQSQRFIRETLLLCDGLDADYLKANPQLLYCTLLLRELARGKIPAPPAGEAPEASAIREALAGRDAEWRAALRKSHLTATAMEFDLMDGSNAPPQHKDCAPLRALWDGTTNRKPKGGG